MPRWLPLESNPDVVNAFLHPLGLPQQYNVVDVFGFDPEMLAFVPRPVLAVFLLFPYTDADEAAAPAQDAHPADSLFFMKQRPGIGNACGTIAALHALGNTQDKIHYAPDSYFARLFARQRSMTPEQRGDDLIADQELAGQHHEAAAQGQTECPHEDASVDLHFIAFACVNGTLYEFDGLKASPIPHGHTTPESLLEDAVALVKGTFMARSPDDPRFNVMALSAEN
ncbi:putative Ubiquitin carboxyl-terminal hydrolase isozyme L3 [Paratrimastix pyriformis]|uniref:Ubiquitin carboxyl-terminal hydrolase n=1 Tax=Paratrimastix pyriformis TaxID=342808 RepID=A0ABQ8UTI5_9EUKA|nr:putative Ubiquitin carboxyl-terminal hydrolase isozyme L3 [Paratrimastix pyriformis]